MLLLTIIWWDKQTICGGCCLLFNMFVPKTALVCFFFGISVDTGCKMKSGLQSSWSRMLETDRVTCVLTCFFCKRRLKNLFVINFVFRFVLKKDPASQTLVWALSQTGSRLLTQFTATWMWDFSCFFPLYGSSPMCFQLTVVCAKESAQSSSPVIICVSNECFTSTVWFGVRTVWRRRRGIHTSLFMMVGSVLMISHKQQGLEKIELLFWIEQAQERTENDRAYSKIVYVL